MSQEEERGVDEEKTEEKDEEFEEGVENVKDFYGGDDDWYEINEDYIDSIKEKDD